MLILPKPCPVCKARFTPQKHSHGLTKTCSRQCGNKLDPEARKRTLDAAVAARKAASVRALDVQFHACFGKLSERELRLVRMAAEAAYNRGYSTARYTERRRSKASAA